MKKVVAFDLETIADARMTENMPAIVPNKTLKDPLKIAADIENKNTEQLASMGLNPIFNMICSAAWAWVDDSDGTIKTDGILLKEESGESEKELILNFWNEMVKFDHFVTFNGRAFDMRCFLLHGMGYGIRPSVSIDHGRYNKGNHTDLRLILAGDEKFAKGKMDLFSNKFLGRGKTEGIDGAQVQAYWEMGLCQEILDYNKEDCVITMELFKMAEIAGLLEQ